MAIPNLTDNIEETVKNFKVENFIDLTEAKEYAGKLPGLEDIILAGEDMLGEIAEFASKIMKILNTLLDLFDFSKFFDALGLSELQNFIFDLVSDSMGSGTLSDRDALRGIFSDGCASFNSQLTNEYGMNLPNIQVFSLLALLNAMICNGISGAYSSIYSMFANSDSVGDEPHQKMNVGDINKLFGSTVVPMMLKTNKSGSIAMLGDINSVPGSELARRKVSNVGEVTLNYIDGDTSKTKDPSSVYDNVIGNIEILDPQYNMIGGKYNLSKVKGKKKLSFLSKASALSREKIPDLNNATATSLNLPYSVLNLF